MAGTNVRGRAGGTARSSDRSWRRRPGRLFTAEDPRFRDFVLSATHVGRGILDSMDVNGLVLEHLSRGECMRLVGSVTLGRIVFTRQALPAVELVNFALDDGDILIRTDSGGKLAAATRGAVVAFEAGSVDVATHAGWSVTIVGSSVAVTDSEEIRRLNRVELVPWAPGERDHYIRISPSIVNGRRVSTQRLAEASDACRT